MALTPGLTYPRWQLDSTGTPTGILRPDGRPLFAVAKVFVGTGSGAYGTTIPNSTNVVGTYTTKLIFQSTLRDDIGTLVDLANNQFLIPSGYSECRIIYNLAWGLPTWLAITPYSVGDSVVPTVSNNYQYVATSITTGISGGTQPTWPTVVGNTVVDGGVTWTCQTLSDANGWRGARIKNAAGNNYGNVRLGSVGSQTTTNTMCVTPWMPILASGATAPDSINAGDTIAVYPSQTSGQPMRCGADSASSFVQIELR